MSDVLNSLNAPEKTSWAEEVASVAAEAPAETPAPEPAHTAEPEQEAAPEPSQPQETASEEHDRRVPLKALQEERQKRAEYERQVQDYQRQLQEYQAWASEVQRQQMGHNGGPPLEQETPPPDPETDPIGALKYAREQQRQLQEQFQQQQAAQQQQQYVQQLNQVAYQSAVQYQQQVPDYQDAYKYALQSRAQELAALGTPQHAIGQILQREELSLIDTALRNGRNPAEAIYHFAKARGFGNSAPPAAPAPAAAPDPVLQETKRAVAASASAGGAPASKGGVSVADLANLQGAAFDSAWNKLFGGNKNSIFRE